MQIRNITTNKTRVNNFKAENSTKNTILDNLLSKPATKNKKTDNGFKMLTYTKAKTLEEAEEFAYKNFHIINFDVKDVSSANSINRTLTDVYNETRGEAHFPPILTLQQTAKGRYSGYCSPVEVNIINIPSKTQDLLHELGHYNHMQITEHYKQMGKYNELIEDGVKDFSIFNKFHNDKQSLKLIKKHLSGYATSSPAEFIACAFNALMNNKKLPEGIYSLYKDYEGPFAEIFLTRIKK